MDARGRPYDVCRSTYGPARCAARPASIPATTAKEAMSATAIAAGGAPAATATESLQLQRVADGLEMSINDIQWVTDAPGKCWGSCSPTAVKKNFGATRWRSSLMGCSRTSLHPSCSATSTLCGCRTLTDRKPCTRRRGWRMISKRCCQRWQTSTDVWRSIRGSLAQAAPPSESLAAHRRRSRNHQPGQRSTRVARKHSS
jgi:hypothetical protein